MQADIGVDVSGCFLHSPTNLLLSGGTCFDERPGHPSIRMLFLQSQGGCWPHLWPFLGSCGFAALGPRDGEESDSCF